MPESLPKILIIDDDPIFGLMVGSMLDQQGARAVHVRNLKDAARLLDTGEYAAAIIDGLLPDGVGVDFIKKRRGKGERIPFVFCSAFWKDLGSHQQLKHDLDVRAVLVKPSWKPNDLLGALAPLVTLQPEQKEAPRPRVPRLATV